jgi:hypothetical protein
LIHEICVQHHAASSHVDRSVELRYFAAMNFGIRFEKVTGKDFPAGYFYTHLPSLALTTHGLGIEGARAAADLVKLWLTEKKANHEPVFASSEILCSTLDFSEDALQGA